MFAASYVKGGKISDVREKDLGRIFNLSIYRFSEDMECVYEQCRELLKRKGKVYAVFFKKRLVGLYVLECIRADLYLKQKLLMPMDELVEAEIDQGVKRLIHKEIFKGEYEGAVFEGNVLGLDEEDRNKKVSIMVPIIICMTNPMIATISTSLAGSRAGAVVSIINIIMIMYIAIMAKKGGKKNEKSY